MTDQPQISLPQPSYVDLTNQIKHWAKALGFQACAISGIDLTKEEAGLMQWLDQGYHGDMDYMARHGPTRARPAELVPGTLCVISVRLNYAAPHAQDAEQVMGDAALGFVSRYALGRDYHKVLRSKLQKLAEHIEAAVGPFGHRVFTDSAPVMEVALAHNAGLGWRGKHTLLLSRDAGSMFFIGELFTDLPLVHDSPTEAYCGSCTRCIDVCPTQAIIAPYLLDARRCISYLTIEHKGSVPLELRPLMGNRVYGCDDCQLFCPWNKYAQVSTEPDFAVRNGLDAIGLVEAMAWTAIEFDRKLEGSAIRRIGHAQWQRNIAIAMGNALRELPQDDERRTAICSALLAQANNINELVREHVQWALDQEIAGARAIQIQT
jgi:epoxyqueuosine reductase